MNWLAGLMVALKWAPVIVAGIEQIHADASGATKQQLAIEALTLATGVAQNVLPANKAAMAGGISSHLAQIVDAVVGIFNFTGVFKHKGSSAVAVHPAAA